MRISQHRTTLVKGNWKTALTAFTDGYHTSGTQSRFLCYIDDTNWTYETVGIGLEEDAWVDRSTIQIDPPSGWTEAPDDAVPGYRRQRYETETEANSVARRFRSMGFSACTELVADDTASDR